MTKYDWQDELNVTGPTVGDNGGCQGKPLRDLHMIVNPIL